jgi:hypothetical protein
VIIGGWSIHPIARKFEFKRCALPVEVDAKLSRLIGGDVKGDRLVGKRARIF